MKDSRDQYSDSAPSPLLQHFAKSIEKPQYALPLQQYRSVSKMQPNHHNNNQTFSIHNRPLNRQTSRRKLQLPQAQLQQRYQQIQKILVNQNSNLKQQNQYLAIEIRRITKKEKANRHQLQEITYRSSQQQEHIEKLQQNLSEIKGFIEQNIQHLTFLLKSSSLPQFKNILSSFIEGISAILCLQITDRMKIKEGSQNVLNVYQDQSNNVQSIDKEIEELSVRLESLIKENNSSCRDPLVRRECIEIARQIKQLQSKKKIPGVYKSYEESANFERSRTHASMHARNHSSHQKTSQISLKQQSRVRKQQVDDKFRYPRQIHKKGIHRRSASKQSKLLHANSVSSMLNKKGGN